MALVSIDLTKVTMSNKEFDEPGNYEPESISEYTMWYLSEHYASMTIFAFCGFVLGLIMGHCVAYDNATRARDDYVRTELSAKWDNELGAYIRFDRLRGYKATKE